LLATINFLDGHQNKFELATYHEASLQSPRPHFHFARNYPRYVGMNVLLYEETRLNCIPEARFSNWAVALATFSEFGLLGPSSWASVVPRSSL
jgi:hypothetical protein